MYNIMKQNIAKKTSERKNILIDDETLNDAKKLYEWIKKNT